MLATIFTNWFQSLIIISGEISPLTGFEDEDKIWSGSEGRQA
jgi:hypothetical protein